MFSFPVSFLTLHLPSFNQNSVGYTSAAKRFLSYFSLDGKLLQPSSGTRICLDSGIHSIFEYSNSSDEVTFEKWIDDQTERSFNGILNNIGGVGLLSGDVSPGAVIASPSKSQPNYFYQWIRDAAITINSLVEHLNDTRMNTDAKMYATLICAIESYILNNFKLQRTDNKSGTWDSLEGLGEPKFMVDSTPFNDHWGRPQRDGPGLRVITISNYVNFLLENALDVTDPELLNVAHIYNQIVKPDLIYIMESWNKNGFDLWEEVDSIHLFTSITMLKALKMGIKLSEEFRDSDFTLKLKISFNTLRFFILFESGFKNPNIPYLIETPTLLVEGKRSGLDIGSILGCLLSHNLDDPSDLVDIPFAVSDSAILSTLNALINDMKYRYPINHGNTIFNKGFALGRYPEDLYDGYGISEGNPWFISTATASELLFKIVYYLYYYSEDLIIEQHQISFYSSFISLSPCTTADTIVLPYGSDAFIVATTSLMKYADSFLEVIQNHVDQNGHMSEQFNRYNGYMEGATDLTWSYGSFWSAIRWRKKAEHLVKGFSSTYC